MQPLLAYLMSRRERLSLVALSVGALVAMILELMG